MIISVDGYDGTGKSTLAKKIMENDGFIYIYKPKIYMLQDKYGYTLAQAIKILENDEKTLFQKPLDKKRIIEYYSETLLWLKKYSEKYDIILDRGILTTYAVVGNKDTEEYFDYYIKKGVFYDASIYLTADDNERVRRIYNNNPLDPDLKYPIKWRENNLEEYATSRNLNYYKIETDNKNPNDVYEESIKFIYQNINTDNSFEEIKKLRLIKNKGFSL